MNLIKEKYKLFLTKKIILIFHLKKKKKKIILKYIEILNIKI